MSTQTELHNRVAPEVVRSIVRPVIEAGGRPPDVMVLLESIAVGVIRFVAINTGKPAEEVARLLTDGVNIRLADMEGPPVVKGTIQ